MAGTIDALYKKSLAELNIPLDVKPHPAGEYLINLWRKLCNTRQYTELGPQPIGMDDIYYYFKLIDYQPIAPIQWEIDTLMTIDQVWLSEYYIEKNEQMRGAANR